MHESQFVLTLESFGEAEESVLDTTQFTHLARVLAVKAKKSVGLANGLIVGATEVDSFVTLVAVIDVLHGVEETNGAELVEVVRHEDLVDVEVLTIDYLELVHQLEPEKVFVLFLDFLVTESFLFLQPALQSLQKHPSKMGLLEGLNKDEIMRRLFLVLSSNLKLNFETQPLNFFFFSDHKDSLHMSLLLKYCFNVVVMFYFVQELVVVPVRPL